MEHIDFVYFGGEPLGVPILEELEAAGLLPSLVICNPDRPSGRGHVLTPPPVKIWAEARGIEIFQPQSYKTEETKTKLSEREWDLFVVVAYNFILPNWLLSLPKYQVLNVHPSLLPRLRGASPIRTAIKDDLRDAVGVSVMLLDEQMDHGPILRQLKMPIEDATWPLSGPTLDVALAHAGGALLAETMRDWVAGGIEPKEQDHSAATYCSKLDPTDRQLHIDPRHLPTAEVAKEAWHLINAFAGIGDTFFIHNGKRVKIKAAELTNGSLRLLRVIPEGKKEVSFEDYLRTL